MAQHKVIQDIEAEDKLLGPLSLKGLVYAGIAGGLVYINFRIAITTGLGPARWVIVLILLFPMLLFALLASPIGRDQPTEVWILSHVRFFLKPRKRIWNQSGISHLVTITVPKKIERQLTKGLTKGEVNSRLKALAMTLDSRGWAVKNVDVNLALADDYNPIGSDDSDRLVNVSGFQADDPLDVHAADDIMDEQSNSTAQHFETLMEKADVRRREDVLERFNAAREGRDISGTGAPSSGSGTAAADEEDDEDEQPKTSLKKKPETPKEAVTEAQRAAKLELAQSGKAFKVSTLAQLANRGNEHIKQIGPNEVEISLH